MSEHMVITFRDTTRGRRYKAEIEYSDGKILEDTVTIASIDMEIPGRPRIAVAWSFKCSFRRALGTSVEQVVESAIEALLEASPGALG